MAVQRVGLRPRRLWLLLRLPVLFALVFGMNVAFGEDIQTIDYAKHEAVLSFIEDMAAQHGYDENALRQLFGEVRYQQSIVDAITRPAEKRLLWRDYRKIFLTEARIQKGAKFWLDNERLLDRVVAKYQVSPAIIVAILGVETFYGTRIGGYRVMDALTTLAFNYPPRATFFLGELRHFLLLARDEGNKNPLDFKGSYAGAMGYGQFIPSSFRHYAVDFDKDGTRDIWHNTADALGSVANYLKRHHWHADEPVVHSVEVTGAAFEAFVNKGIRRKGLANGTTAESFRRLGVHTDLPSNRKLALIRFGEEQDRQYWLAENNFFVITTYNTSRLYAMAVYDLSRAVLATYCDAKASHKLAGAPPVCT